VYVSTTSFAIRNLDEILTVCKNHNISAIELSSVKGYDLDELRRNERSQKFLVHNYFPQPSRPFLLNLASQDQANLKRSIDHCRFAIDLSAELGGKVYAAHGGFGYDLTPELLGRPEEQSKMPENILASNDKVFATLLESVKVLTSYGRERGVRFLIENNVLSRANGAQGRRLIPMAHPDDLVMLARELNDPWFGFLLDVGHAKVSANALNINYDVFFEKMSSYIYAFHLSDNNGLYDQNNSFDKGAWFMSHLRFFPKATFTLELCATSPENILMTRDHVLEVM
jgi:sugar phosphate isomerase/epimerase